MDLKVYQELEQATYDLSSRCLYQASRWAAEQLVGLDEAQQATNIPPAPSPLDRHPKFILATAYFQDKDYRRASHILKGVPGPKALFIRLYSQYLAGEKRREEERVEKSGPLGESHTLNPELDDIDSQLHAECQAGTADAFLLYLYGIVLLDKEQKKDAREVLLRSLHLCPCNWNAWRALQTIVTDAVVLKELHLPVHWTREFFLAAAHLDLQENQEALSKLQRLSHVFPNSSYMVSLVAQAHYNLQNFDEAQSLFEDIIEKDPHRLEGMDTLSNILFVKEQFVALSHLAHRAVAMDKYRPETCCIVGNYYSLKGEHEKAVVYFRRALHLDRSCLGAWTLMGHEYMEMKNTSAAIDAYRHAIDLNRHDFRAWYGLGQAYELLKMPFYAVYYYRRAAALRPTDARMWCALGQCYIHEQVNMTDLAIRCYRRAIEHNDPDGIAVHMLAKLYEGRHDDAQAEKLYRYNLARLDAEAGSTGGLGGGGPSPPLGTDSVEALLFLAGRCKDTNRLEEAQQFSARLMDVGGQAKERAKALAREVHALQQQQKHGSSGGGGGHDGAGRGGRGAAPFGMSRAQGAGHSTPAHYGGSPMTLNFATDSVLGKDRHGWLAGGDGGDDDDKEGSMFMVDDDDDDDLQLDGANEDEEDGLDSLSVSAVMQQLRVTSEVAHELLLKSGGDPIAAIRANMHLIQS